ncbi:hypothetical protein P8C59_001318 [Phyllachora maydis]|uniref:Sm domain-containing protein n=1 Tax=Phyllachora maydis TaxID=1825666 RepID=A0AAD9HXY1_9PEZI|nr:hypothetical protein P8C59_001318 [Phyllachora maydis]
MLPLGLLNAAQGHPMLVELKNGETLNGHLVMCDTWMNLTLKEVVQTSAEGDRFVRLPEVYVKGNNIKYLRVPDELIDLVKDQQHGQQNSFRGGRDISQCPALVNHPDYLCRNRVLEEMRNGWIDLTDDGKCAVALGLLRDGQVELASEELEKMIRVGTDVPSWVWDVFVFCFLRYGFVNEALTLTRQRLDMVGSATAIPLGTWHFLLDACAEAQHYEGARLLWQRFVRPGILQPSDGTTMSMINTASRNMDPELATEAIQVLATRGVNLGLHHYEPLIECYTTAGDIGNALRALSIMAEAEMQPDRASTRSIYLLLRASPSRTEEAIAVLTELSKERGMPITALNVVLEALYHQEDSARAVDLYRQVRDICPEGPDMHTFEILLSRPISEKLADFIASEMSAFSIRPNCTMYDNLVCSHGKDGDLETAMRYVWKLGNELARSGGFLKEENWLSKRTLQVLLRRLFLEADARLWALVDEAKRRGVLVDEDVQKIISGALLEVDADAEAAGRQDAVLEALPESRPPGALLAQ